jgi:Tfp pilus assembly protein PilO
LGELNEKTNKLAKDLVVKDAAIKEAEGRIKQLKEANDKEIKALKENHHRETINLYVDYRLKSMRLKLHEKVLTLLRQSNSTNEVDTLIRETQDALREGLAQSVGNISEITLERPVDKNQVDITNKVGIALKHLTGL